MIGLSHAAKVVEAAGATLRLAQFCTAPPAAFDLFDDVVSDATQLGTSFVDDPRDVAHYVQLFDRLDALALYGDDARAALARVWRAQRRSR